MESKYLEFSPKAKGDLGALDEDEEGQAKADEEWENYKKSGGKQTRKQFDEDQKVKACEEYLKVELKLKANASERQLAGAQWSLLLKAARNAVLIHLNKGKTSGLALAIKVWSLSHMPTWSQQRSKSCTHRET